MSRSQHNSTGPLPAWLSPVARAASLGYAYVLNKRNKSFDTGHGIVTFDRPVISIGNLSVGGTGKTPVVSWLIQELLMLGHRPCIAMRGYGATNSNLSDEAQEYAAKFGDNLPIIAQPNRAEGLIELFASERGETINCVVLDDGFQHRKIARDVNVVLIDCNKDPWRDALLPLGWLREPPQALRRADAVILTHAFDDRIVDTLINLASRVNPKLVFAACRHEWQGFHAPLTSEYHPTTYIEAKSVVACSAIGNPGAFLGSIRSLNPSACVEFTLRDHDPYTPTTIERLLTLLSRNNAQCLVTTAKDWSKLNLVRKNLWPCEVLVTDLGLRWLPRPDIAPLRSFIFDRISSP